MDATDVARVTAARAGVRAVPLGRTLGTPSARQGLTYAYKRSDRRAPAVTAPTPPATAPTTSTPAAAPARTTIAGEADLATPAPSATPQPGSTGIRGFLHWQYRGETLGSEAPAWGLLEPDGSIGITHEAAAEFWRVLRPVAGRLMQVSPALPEVAIFRSCANEIFHWCAHGNTEDLGEAVRGFTHLFYELNVGVGFVNEAMVIRGLPRRLRLLVLPLTWALDQPTADAIRAWVEQGGIVICEGLTGSFDLTHGRHSEQIPGLGLATAFGLQEARGTAVRHLRIGQAEDASAEKLGEDFAKALKSFGLGGGDFVFLRCESGELMTGRRHYAEIAGEKVTGLAARPGNRRPSVGWRKVGQGTVYYAATQIGWLWGPEQRQESLRELARHALTAAGITPTPGGADGLRVDHLETPDGVAVVLTNLTDHPVEYTAERGTSLVGLFSGKTASDGAPFHLTLNPQQAELLVPPGWLGSLGSPA